MNENEQKSHTGGDRIHLYAYDRLRVIHQQIANQTFPSAGQLAAHFEVSVRTIRRYIAFMRERFNAPIKFDTKKKGFGYTHPNWEMPLIALTEGELLAFFIATIALQGTGAAYENERLRRAVAKIASSLPESVSVSLGYLFENTSFQPPPQVLVSGTTLDILHRAIGEREIIKFSYDSTTSGITKNRRVEPLLLHNHEGTWYVVGYDFNRGKEIIFHTARISDLEPTGDYFDGRKTFDKNKYLRESFGMYRGGSPVEVEIIFDQYQSKWMRERNFFHPEEKREETTDGRLKLSFTVGEDSLEAVARFCLQYTGHFVAVKPEKLRNIIKENLERGLKQHS